MPDYRSLAEFRYHLRKFLHASEVRVLQDGLEPQQHQLLLAIKGLSVTGEDTSIAVLAQRLLLKHHSVVGLVDRLEEKGFVRRCRDEHDRRRVEVQLTDLGEATIAKLTAFHQRELNVLAPELIELLQSVIDTAQLEDTDD